MSVGTFVGARCFNVSDITGLRTHVDGVAPRAGMFSWVCSSWSSERRDGDVSIFARVETQDDVRAGYDDDPPTCDGAYDARDARADSTARSRQRVPLCCVPKKTEQVNVEAARVSIVIGVASLEYPACPAFLVSSCRRCKSTSLNRIDPVVSGPTRAKSCFANFEVRRARKYDPCCSV